MVEDVRGTGFSQDLPGGKPGDSFGGFVPVGYHPVPVYKI
jgi:hypothetical protein